MRVLRLWVPLCLAGMLFGCGQKGPLVQPDTPRKHKKAAPSPPAAPARPAAGAPAPPPAGMPATDAASTSSDKTPKP